MYLLLILLLTEFVCDKINWLIDWNGSNRRAPTDKWTDTHAHTHTHMDATKCIISPATWSIMNQSFVGYILRAKSAVDWCQLNVGAVFIKGEASQLLMDSCHGSSIVMVTSVPYQSLTALAASTGAILCTCITECTQVSVQVILSTHTCTLALSYSWNIFS